MSVAAPVLPEWTLADREDVLPAVVRSGEDLDGVRIVGPDFVDLSLTDVTFRDTEFVGARMARTGLSGCRFLDVRMERLEADDLVAGGSTWRDCLVLDSRLGGVSLYDATLHRVHIRGCKIGYLNLRGATVTDVMMEDCLIGELDVAAAVLTRVSFPNTTISHLAVGSTALKDVDLRGATVAEVSPLAGLRGATIGIEQLSSWAHEFAAELGIVVD